MFDTIRDFHDLSGNFLHPFQILDSNADHAGVIGEAGKDGFPRDFGPDMKKGYVWYDNQVFWDHR